MINISKLFLFVLQQK